jgi:hypothetical protein
LRQLHARPFTRLFNDVVASIFLRAIAENVRERDD